MTSLPNIPDAAVEAAARAMAILDEHDGCFLEVDAWNASEEWERDAHPENYPGLAIEGCAYWLKVAKAGMEAAAPRIMAEAWDQGCYEGLEWRPEQDYKALEQNPYRSAGAGE